MRSIILLLGCILLFSCSSEKERLLSPDRLESFYIKIDHTKDVVFQTPKGAAIKILKGTFNKDVELEIKEAYTMQDILMAGLTTESNGQPLFSGGMIYINTKDKEEVAVNNNIQVAIPTSYVNEDMQLFKGEELGDTAINWVQPDTLPSTPQTAFLEDGKRIFQQNCQTCHAVNRSLTGPALNGFEKRGPWKERGELYKWIANPAAFMKTNQYTQNLRDQYNGVIMPAFPDLSNVQIDAIAAYLINEGNNPFATAEPYGEESNSTDTSDNGSSSSDSICINTYYINPTDTVPEEIIIYPVDTSVFSFPDTVSEWSAEGMEGLRGGFTDMVESSGGVYQFNINTLGWYNIDAFVRGFPGTTLCDLTIQILPQDFKGMNVYVFFPKFKDLSVGDGGDDNIYRFEKIEGKIPMYLGAEGFVLAFGSNGDELYYGTAKFFAKPSQIITVTPKPSTEEEFLNVIKEGKLEGINLDLIKKKKITEYGPCNQQTPASDTTSSADVLGIIEASNL